jgi:hypothetical protein
MNADFSTRMRMIFEMRMFGLTSERLVSLLTPIHGRYRCSSFGEAREAYSTSRVHLRSSWQWLSWVGDLIRARRSLVPPDGHRREKRTKDRLEGGFVVPCGALWYQKVLKVLYEKLT